MSHDQEYFVENDIGVKSPEIPVRTPPSLDHNDSPVILSKRPSSAHNCLFGSNDPNPPKRQKHHFLNDITTYYN